MGLTQVEYELGECRKIKSGTTSKDSLIILRDYASSTLYNESIKRWYDAKILKKEFTSGYFVLIFDSSFMLFWGKLKIRWSGPFMMVR